MISVKKDYSKIPQKLASNACALLKENAIENKVKHKFKSEYYAGGCRTELVQLYNNKCCYCESDPSPAAFWQVEHFRPKGKSPNKTLHGVHNGYYWLGYEWSNLLLVCPSCNNKKDSHFPIHNEANRLIVHPKDHVGNIISSANDPIYLSEGSVLLNPEVDTVEDFFIFKPNGEIKGIDQSGRGQTCIDLCNLQRERLVLDRKKVADDYFDDIKDALYRYNNGILNETSLIDFLEMKFCSLKKKSINKSIKYSRVWYFLFNKFEIFAKEFLPNQGDLELVVARYNRFLSTHH